MANYQQGKKILEKKLSFLRLANDAIKLKYSMPIKAINLKSHLHY
ncbi:hypothetical protein SynPROS91_01780 [Synechococcus sp. PROS-9-1]|nr:hypothetical protein SynPROS91_01780 [Synechococcus sp. PROS-9-1]